MIVPVQRQGDTGHRLEFFRQVSSGRILSKLLLFHGGPFLKPPYQRIEASLLCRRYKERRPLFYQGRRK